MTFSALFGAGYRSAGDQLEGLPRGLSRVYERQAHVTFPPSTPPISSTPYTWRRQVYAWAELCLQNDLLRCSLARRHCSVFEMRCRRGACRLDAEVVVATRRAR
jgi:uncharacterized Fe-S radical SAM superfamily protein PflX